MRKDVISGSPSGLIGKKGRHARLNFSQMGVQGRCFGFGDHLTSIGKLRDTCCTQQCVARYASMGLIQNRQHLKDGVWSDHPVMGMCIFRHPPSVGRHRRKT